MLDPQRKRSGHIRAAASNAPALFPSSLPLFPTSRTTASIPFRNGQAHLLLLAPLARTQLHCCEQGYTSTTGTAAAARPWAASTAAGRDGAKRCPFSLGGTERSEDQVPGRAWNGAWAGATVHGEMTAKEQLVQRLPTITEDEAADMLRVLDQREPALAGKSYPSVFPAGPGRPATAAEFEELFGDLRTDDEP